MNDIDVVIKALKKAEHTAFEKVFGFKKQKHINYIIGLEKALENNISWSKYGSIDKDKED